MKSTTLAILVGLAALWPAAAHADLRLCNMTQSRVGVALGYRDAQGWQSEGWWNLKPNECETMLKGPLATRYYYVYAQDYDRGGEWAGKTFMCTRDKEFTIRGTEDCLARGFELDGPAHRHDPACSAEPLSDALSLSRPDPPRSR